MKANFYKNKPLFFSLLLSIGIASTEVPLWICVFSFVMCFWKYLHEKLNIWKIPTKLTPLLGAVIFLIVYLQYRTLLGQEESTTLILGLASLTILNYETENDQLFLVLLGFMILMIKSIFSLDFIWLVPALISFFGLWVTLLSNVKIKKLQYIFKSTLKSLPILVVLFIFFPRLVLFQTKQADQSKAQSGFSEDLNPGKFSEIAAQNQLVFRAEFENNNMNTEELYWRGAVLSLSKGFIWYKGSNENSKVSHLNEGINAIKYKVILEPLNLKNVFVLDKSLKIITSSTPILEVNFNNYQLVDVQNQQVQFEAMSAFNYEVADEDDSIDLAKYLIVPDLPPKTTAYVEDLKSKKLNPREKLETLKKFFRQKGFIYTLKPEFYRNNLDEFLFERKKGFCEHFAAAFGTLARAVGIPSRIVLGYQGGLYNSIGNFWKISQKDAHAWVEVGIDGHWTRIDPTALVAPLRLSIGGENYFSLSEDEQILFSKNSELKRNGHIYAAYLAVKLFLENLNYYWTIFLLNYDLQAQLEYLKQFRGNWFLNSLFVAAVLAILFFIRKRNTSKKINKHAMYEMISWLEEWALKKGIAMKPEQTPLQNLAILEKKYPQLKETLAEISDCYQVIVYQEKTKTMNLKELNKKWKSDLRSQ